MGDTGIEHPRLALSKTRISGERCAKRGARPASKTGSDPYLSQIVQVWPRLPAHIKAAIRALVETSRGNRKDTAE